MITTDDEAQVDGLTLEVAGLPLQPGRSYSWQLRVDGDDDRAVRYTFMVPGLAGPRIVQG